MSKIMVIPLKVRIEGCALIQAWDQRHDDCSSLIGEKETPARYLHAVDLVVQDNEFVLSYSIRYHRNFPDEMEEIFRPRTQWLLSCL